MSEQGLPSGFDIEREENNMIDTYIRDAVTSGCRRGMPMFSALPLRTEAEVRVEIAPPIGTKTIAEVRCDLIRRSTV